MTSGTNVAELAGGIKTVFSASTPWAILHPLSYWLIAIDTSEYNGENPAVSIYKNLTPNLAPIGFLFFSLRG
jgi:hypothetical protein